MSATAVDDRRPARTTATDVEAPISIRAFVVEASVLVGVMLVATTEVLSLLGALRRVPLILIWTAITIVGGRALLKRRQRFLDRLRSLHLSETDKLLLVAAAIVLVIVGFVALIGATNEWDAMNYHMSRVAHWQQQGSVKHFVTHNPAQNYMPPFAEFAQALVYISAGTDRFVNLVQWLALLGCGLGASLLAKRVGASRPAQMLAAIFAVTAPSAVLEGATAQNDLVLTWWIIAAAALVCADDDRRPLRRAAFVGAAFGLAFLTKGTAIIFLIPIGIWFAVRILRRNGLRPSARMLILSAAIAVVIPAPHAIRNQLSYGAPQGPWNSEYRNDLIAPNVAASNAIRELSLEVALPFTHKDADVVSSLVTRAHQALGLSVFDWRTSVKWAEGWAPTDNWDRYETRAPNPVHVLLILLVLPTAAFRRQRKVLPLVTVIAASALLFCTVLKWQPWDSRFHLPLLVMGGAALAAIVDGFFSRKALTGMGVGLLLLSSPYVLMAPNRPLLGGNSILTTSRTSQYFNTQKPLEAPFRAAMGRLGGCDNIGLITTSPDSFEYPVWAVAHHNHRAPTIRHVLVGEIGQWLSWRWPQPFPKPSRRLLRIDEGSAPPPCGVYAEPPGPQHFTVQGVRFETVWTAVNRLGPVASVSCPLRETSASGKRRHRAHCGPS